MGNDSKCPSCNGSNIETDMTLGFVVCTNCGTVVEDNIIVAEVEFEDQGAKSRAVGQFIANEGQGVSSGMGQINTCTNSRELSIGRARRVISLIANNPQISLPTSFIDGAVNFYKMSLERGLTRARAQKYVAVACLYIVCRLNKTPHLLIDFSEVTQTDVFVLGRVYQVLSNKLCIHLPIIDPCLYVERYGYKLNLGEKTRDVCHTAVRLVARMKRDWIHAGRRPSGICGAALLVASKLHGFTKSVKEIIRVVRISSSVLLNRLKDVGKTSVANLTVDEFFSKKLEDLVEQDPPSFIQARENFLRRSEIEKSNNWLSSSIIDQVLKTNEEIETILGMRSAIELSLTSVQNTGELIPTPVKKIPIASRKSKFKESVTESKAEQPDLQTKLLADSLISLDVNTLSEMAQKFEKEAQEFTPLVTENEQKIIDNPWSDIDDKEIDEFILDEKEVMLKTIIWHTENGKFLKQQKEKERLKMLQKSTQKKRKCGTPKRKVMGLTKVVLDSILNDDEIIPKRSSKLDYSVLERLNNEDKASSDTSKPFKLSEKTTALIDMMMDPKRIDEVLIRKVPDHIQRKYDKRRKDKIKEQQDTENVNNEIDRKTEEKDVPDSPDVKPILPVDIHELCPLDSEVSNLLPYEEQVKLFGFENLQISEEEVGEEYIY